jgi:hypothetical protein
MLQLQADCRSSSRLSALFQQDGCNRVNLCLESVPESVLSYRQMLFDLESDILLLNGADSKKVVASEFGNHVENGWQGRFSPAVGFDDLSFANP